MPLPDKPLRFYCIVLLIVPSLAVWGETSPRRTNPVSATVNLSASCDFPTGETDVRFGLSLPRLSGSALVRVADGAGNGPCGLRTWSVRFRPVEAVSLYAGSISVSGLPARAKNPVTPLSSPELRPPSASRQAIIRSGTALDTGQVGFEAGGAAFDLAAAAHYSGPNVSPCWISARTSSPPVGPDFTRCALALFAGLRPLPESSGDSWFLPDRSLPEGWLFFPAAEITLDGRRFAARCSGFASLGPLSECAGTARAEALFRGSRFAIGGSWLRSDAGFTDFNASEDRIREQIAVSPRLYLPLSRLGVSDLTCSALFGRETVSGDTFNEPSSTRTYYGGLLSLNASGYSASVSLERGEKEDTYATELTIYRFFHRSARMRTRVSLVSTESGLSGRSISDVSGDMRLTITPRAGMYAHGSAGFTCLPEKGVIDPRWKIAVSAAPIATRRARIILAFSLSEESKDAPVSGSVELRANLR